MLQNPLQFKDFLISQRFHEAKLFDCKVKI